jgi:hypothetical protein
MNGRFPQAIGAVLAIIVICVVGYWILRVLGSVAGQ